MSNFDQYSRNFDHIHMERQQGILRMTLHSDGGPLRWSLKPQAELVQAFTDIGADRENRIIILTGTGDEFSGPKAGSGANVYEASGVAITPAALAPADWNAKRLMTRLLDIEVPMIAVVNGPAMRHSELALLCDIVLAADDATFEDTAHFHLGGHVPGDGINVIYTMLLGINRARYFMLTGQVLSAREAKDLGLVSEVMPRDKLLGRAWELALQLAQQPDLLLRHTRIVLTHPLKRQMEEGIQSFVALEALATLDRYGNRK